jgi:MFS family permease
VSDTDGTDRPATFREVLAVGEYRALYAASTLSWFGDYAARAAVTALVYQRTNSVAASAATFAISYLPWVGFGPILAAVAERYPYRRMMITTDILRMILIALVAVPAMPVGAMIALLFATALLSPPFEAARAALLPRILAGDRYVVGQTLQLTTHQAAQIVGYVTGAGLSTVDARAALLFNAVTFGASALLVRLFVQPREPAFNAEERTDLLRETASGLAVVFRSPVLRAVALLVFLSGLFAVVPEGLAAAWAADLTHDPHLRGWVQGAIMIANPVGFVVGGILVQRLMSPARRQRAIPYFAVAVAATLVPALLRPPVAGVLVIAFLCGAAAAGLLPSTNGVFVQALPAAYRARAFGVMKSGIQIVHGVGVFATGWLADRFDLATVVGVWSLAGVGMIGAAALTWPGRERIDTEIARIRELNAAYDAEPPGSGSSRHEADTGKTASGTDPAGATAATPATPATPAQAPDQAPAPEQAPAPDQAPVPGRHRAAEASPDPDETAADPPPVNGTAVDGGGRRTWPSIVERPNGMDGRGTVYRAGTMER